MIATLKKIVAAKAARQNDEGFTLIELLIVIVVLGILAGVVVFSLGSVTGSSAVAACQADGSTVNTAIQAYYAQNGSYPANIAALVPTYLQSAPNSTHYSFSIVSNALTLAGKGTPSVAQTWAGANTCSSATGATQTVA